MTKNAILYLRVSTAEQVKRGGPERQRDNGLQFITEQGWQLEATLSDEGRSAFHGANRSEGSALHRFEIEARDGMHRGKVLVVENLDRLSRQGPKAITQLIWALNEAGVDVAVWHTRKVHKAEEANDLLSLFDAILTGHRAQEESKVKSERGKDVWKKRYQRIESGEKHTVAGHAPNWFRVENRQYVLDPYKAKVINEIFDFYLSGVGIYKIVQMLNERKEPSWAIGKRAETAKGWHIPYVHRLLTKRALIGEYETLDGQTISKDFFPAVVTHEKFNKVQALIQSKSKPRGRDARKMNNLLSGFVRCGSCEGKAAYENKGTGGFTKYKRADGTIAQYPHKHYERLRCDSNRRRYGCTNKVLLDYKVVENAILNRLLDMTVDDQPVSPRLQLLDEEIARLENAIIAVTNALDNLMDNAEGTKSKAFAARIAAREAEIEQHEQDLVKNRRARDAENAKPYLVDDVEAIAQVRAQLTSLEGEERDYARIRTNMALSRIIDDVLILEDNTFWVMTDFAIWGFDHEGNGIGGQAI